MFFIGITLEQETFKVAILKKDAKQTITVVDLQTFPIGPDHVKLFYNLPPFHTGKKVWVSSGLRGEEIFLRKIHFPLKERRKILAALPFQLETLVPFPPDEALIHPLFKPLSKQMTAVTIIATLKERLTSHLVRLMDHTIKPDSVSCYPVGLARFTSWQFPQEQRVLSFHVEKEKILWTVSEKEELVLSQTLFFEREETVSLELDKLLLFLKNKGAIDDRTPWLLTGDQSLTGILSHVFQGPQLQLCESAFSNYAIPLGLALDALKADEHSVQFCQFAFTPVHTHQTRQKKLISYLAACLAAALLMAAGGNFLTQKKQTILVERLQNELTPTLNKGSLSSIQDIQVKLFEWEKSLNRQKTPFPFLPTAPKVSDVLAWISTHPAFATTDGNPKEGIEIKSIHYSLNKYPKIGEPQIPYLAQVEIEFTASTPRAARDFHEALLKGDQLVNGKKEIRWQTQNQTYFAAFELNPGIAR
jgi:type IV pilus assembly protein PilM